MKFDEKVAASASKAPSIAPTYVSTERGPLPSYAAASSAAPQQFQTRFASMSLHMEDRIRFLNFPAEVVDMCGRTIAGTWARGIQDQRQYAGSREFKLSGTPWRGQFDQAISARRLVCALLGVLHRQGWVLTLSTDVSKKSWDKDSMLFRHQSPPPAECDWCCIAFSRTDRIRFIDVPREVYDSAILRLGRPRVQSHSAHSPGVYEAKIKGAPWRANGEESMGARLMLLILLEVLESEGWTVYASIDQKNGSDDNSETDTWHCCKPKAWVRGTPVYHN